MKKMIRNSNSIWQVLAGFTALTMASSAHASEIAARVVTVRGEVIKRGEWNLTSKTPLKANETILEGDTIESKKGGAVKLLFTDKTIVDIGADTTFKVKEYRIKQGGNRQVSLELPEGKIRTSVNQPVGQSGSFRLKTRSVVMGVRGTEFVVESREALAQGATTEAPPTQITVLEGNVAVAQTSSPGGAQSPSGFGQTGETQSVSAGQQLTAGLSPSAGGATGADSTASGAQPSGGVQTISATQAAAVAQSATVSDTTFKSSVDLEGGSSQGSSDSSSSQKSDSGSGQSKSEGKSDSKGESKGESKGDSKGSAPGGSSTASNSGDAPKEGSKGEGGGNAPPPPRAGADSAAPRPPALAQLAAVVQASAGQVAPRIDVGNLGVPGANSVAPPPPPPTNNFSLVGQPAGVKIHFTP